MAPVVRNKDQQVTVGNTYLLDTGLSNAVTIEKCTFLKFAFLFLVFDSPIEYQIAMDGQSPSICYLLFN